MKKQNAKTIQAQIIKALDVRAEYATAKVNTASGDKYRAEQKKFSETAMLASIQKMIDFGYNFAPLSENLLNTDKADCDATSYVAIYALQKVRKALAALGSNIALSFDDYTIAIVSNLTRLQTLSTMNAQRTIARSIEFDELEQQVSIKNRMNCKPSTASTQASSTREMLRILDVCIVHKKHKNDSISFQDNGQAKAVQAMFASIAA